MAKKTRIPELVVGKIFIDGGDKDKVYTIGSDEDGALRIGDSKSNMVATIDQKTGKIVANSFAGDGSALAGISAEGLAELQTAKLLTLSADKLFFNFDADGVADQSQKITLTAKTQNIDNPVFRWYVNSAEASSTGATKEVTVSELGGNEEVIVTVELDNESLSETVTLHKLQAGRTGRDAVIVSMSNPSVTYQADSEGNIDETDAALMAPGATNIVVRYGAQKLTPVTGTPGDGEFSVTAASSEYVTVPTDPSYIAPDTTNNKMDIGAPANVIAAVGTISFSVTAQVDGEVYSFTEIQTFNLSIPGQTGATGEGAKFVKLTSDDYQIGYDSDGLSPDPEFVTLTAAEQNHETTVYYRWFVDDVPWNPGLTGSAISPTPTQHFYTTDTTMKLPAESSHGAFGSKKTVRVETQVSGDDDDPISSDSVSIIATKDGSNAIRITADNLSHGFPASPTGQIDASDYADGAVTFQVYHGNENFTPNMTVINNLKGLVQSTNPGTSPDLSSITSYVSNLGDGEYAVLADATTAVINDADANTIDPFGGAAPSSVTDDTGVGIKFSPGNMQESLRRAAINYSFYLRTLDGQLAASTVRTQTFVKGRDGEQGQPGLPGNPGDPGTDAVAVKLVLDDYQVGFDENGGNPQTAAGDGTVTMTLTTQGHDEALTVYRVYKDDVEEPVHNPQGEDWEQYGWRKLTSGTPWTGTHVFDFSGETYSDWTNRKKVVRVETSQIEYVNGVLQDTSNLSAQAQDSTTIIATKEGSNAVEIFADNLSHQFIEDTAGNIDYTGGGIKFSAYIGNTPLVASNESTIEDFKASNEADAFHVSCGADAQDNISKGITTLSDANTFFFLDPSNFGKDDDNRSIASLTFTISVKDSTGTVRPDRTFVQTLTRAKDGSDSKLVRIDASSTVFAFDDDWDWTAQPNEITFNIATQNLASGEEVAASDITFIDKDGNDVSAAVKGYVNPPDGNGDEKTNEQLIEASLQGGSSFSLRFAQFQGLAKDEDGNTIPAAVYQNNQGETIENSSYTLQQLKANGFPLTVKVTKTGLAGAVQTISDETRVLALMGGTNTVQIDAPNSTHLFDADADMVVNPTTLGDAGTDITVYVGAAPLSYDSSGDTELQRGKYRFGDFQYGSATGEGSSDQMVTLSVRSDKTGVDVDSVSHEYTKQTVTLPIEIRRTDGELINRNLFLTYSKVKEGRDGENLKDRNFDFSQGPTGWSLDDTSTKGSDLTSAQLTVDSDEKANFGGSIGVFHFVDPAAPPTPNSMMEDIGKSKTIYISEALPVGATAEPGSNEDDGTWLIKFRAKAENHPDLDAGSSLKATNNHTSPIRAWLSIKPFSGDGTPYSPVPAVDNTSPLFYFDVPQTAWASAATVHGKLGFSTNDDAGYSYDDYSVPLLKDHYLTYVLRVTPAEIQAMMGTAASFKIAMRFKGTALGTDKSPLIKVDAFQAEKLPYSSLLGFDEEQWGNLQDSLQRLGDVETSRAEEAAEGDMLQDLGVLEDMSSLTNYNFANKYSNNFPASVIPAVWTSDGSEEFSYSDDNLPMGSPVTITGITAAEDSQIIDGGRAIKLCHATGKRHSVTFPIVSIPAPNYKICLKIRYKTDSTSTLVNNDWSTESATNGPLVRLYFSEDYAEGKKYIITQDTNYNYAGSDDVTHRRVDDNDDGENIVCSVPLDYAPTWRTQEKIITLDAAGIGSSYNNLKSGKELKYFSISLFPGSDSGSGTGRDRDLTVDYIDMELLPPVNLYEMDRTRSDALTPWETTTPGDERTATKADTFNDTRFTDAESNASDGKAAHTGLSEGTLEDDGTGKMRLNFGPNVSIGSLVSPTAVSNQVITIGNDGALSGIGTTGVKVNNEAVFEDERFSSIKGQNFDFEAGKTGWVEGYEGDATLKAEDSTTTADISVSSDTAASYGSKLATFSNNKYFYTSKFIVIDSKDKGKYRFTVRKKQIGSVVPSDFKTRIRCFNANSSPGVIYLRENGSHSNSSSNPGTISSVFEETVYEITAEEIQNLRPGTTKFLLSFQQPSYTTVMDVFKVEYSPHANLEEMDPTADGRAKLGAGANSMIDGATFDVNADGTMTLSFGADTVNNVDVGSTPTLNPTTKVSNNSITIGGDGVISGIGTAGIGVSNANAFDGGVGLTVKTTAEQGVSDAATAQTAAAAADTKAQQGVDDAAAAQTLATTANTLAGTVDGRFLNERLKESHSLNNKKTTGTTFITDPQEGDVLVNSGDGNSLPVPYLYGTKEFSLAIGGRSFSSLPIYSNGTYGFSETSPQEHTINSNHNLNNFEYLKTLVDFDSGIRFEGSAYDGVIGYGNVFMCGYNNAPGISNLTVGFGIAVHPGMSSLAYTQDDTIDFSSGITDRTLSNNRIDFDQSVTHTRLIGYNNPDSGARQYWDSLVTLTRGESPDSTEDLYFDVCDNMGNILDDGDASEKIYDQGSDTALVSSTTRTQRDPFFARVDTGTTSGVTNPRLRQWKTDSGTNILGTNYDVYRVHDWLVGRRMHYSGYAMPFRKAMVRGDGALKVKATFTWIGLVPTHEKKLCYFAKGANTTNGYGDIINKYNFTETINLYWRVYNASTETWSGWYHVNSWYKGSSNSGNEITWTLSNISGGGEIDEGQKFQIGIRFQNRPGVLQNVVLNSIKVEGAWHEDKDSDLETKVYEVASDSSTNFSTFTGKHRCVVEGDIPGVGMLVSSTGKYDNVNHQHELEEELQNRYRVNPQEAVPVVVTTTQEKDKTVLGVLCREDKKSKKNSYFLSENHKAEANDIPRFEINSLGEGGIWVSNIAGDLENGDYICSSNIPGYGMKQDDDILRNYTVAKITQDCLFDLDSEDYDCKEVEHDGTIYKVAFVGCTYHCG